jgi:hypothetical protein
VPTGSRPEAGKISQGQGELAVSRRSWPGGEGMGKEQGEKARTKGSRPGAGGAARRWVVGWENRE